MSGKITILGTYDIFRNIHQINSQNSYLNRRGRLRAKVSEICPLKVVNRTDDSSCIERLSGHFEISKYCLTRPMTSCRHEWFSFPCCKLGRHLLQLFLFFSFFRRNENNCNFSPYFLLLIFLRLSRCSSPGV